MTIKKVLTVIAVLSCYGWGTFAWFTGGLLLADQLPVLAKLTNLIYLAALLAPFIRVRLGRFTNSQLLVGLSCLSGLGMAAMMDRNLLPFGYLAVGFLRLFLMPVMTSFTAPNLGAVMTVVLLNGGFNGANAILKPQIANLVASNNWRLGLGIGIGLIAVSAVTAYLATNTASATGSEEEVNLQPNPKKLGSMIIVLLGIQLFYGLREIAVYRVAKEMFGSTTSAGVLEAITESAMLVGVFLTPLLRAGIVVPMLIAQAGASLLFVAALHFSNAHLLYAAQIVEGLSYAVLERISEVTYLQELGGLPNAGLAFQWIDSLTRVGPMPSRMLASSPLSLEIIFSVMAGVSLLIIALHRTSLAGWTGQRFFAIAESSGSRRQGLRIRILQVVLIVRFKIYLNEAKATPPQQKRENRLELSSQEVAQLLSRRIR
jgi:hypothetical protein